LLSHEYETTDLAKGTIVEFMASENSEILGAVFTLIHKQPFYKRITPPLTFSEYHAFNLKYYKRCLLTDSKGEWCNSRYEAGWSFVGWFKKLFADADVPREAIMDLKLLLEDLYKIGDEKLQTALITSILEHLFEEEEIKLFFSNWKTDPLLCQGYIESIEYANNLIKHKRMR
jgi:hypothetical protein